ncbi:MULTISPECIES: hypothetical protein [unclassified Caulobacter]|uniref:hypothetical protein n=1 Tax=unclassified Caulobacter TaxID=2648921 RepID=UPI0011B4F231|nr:MULTISPECIES: hypothetical protein [unclassified Caulobacter]
MKRLPLLHSLLMALALTAVACSPKPSAPAVTPPRPEQLKAVAESCGAPQEWFSVGPDGRVLVITSGDVPYDRIACVHRELERQGVPGKVGMIMDDPR